MTADLTRAEVERDEHGWPVRMSEGLRLCSRPGVSHYGPIEEFRIDGYCSCECRDMHELEVALSARDRRIEELTRLLEHVARECSNDGTPRSGHVSNILEIDAALAADGKQPGGTDDA